ncbi:hypothetical protein Rsub_12896 [Raphidocelis subcapitata]|uniref:DUF2470 domain-containing protein n=1 Tax=Raphidocelis subcapitata TaxID=307507 RepID=A0A2V0PKB8_9CHLO|nr:hypothetical protein Rsub_12896 [Raphidocelis subcapitata]|eukprot:GBG00252.1 hypothetical protein Rsub_12896 [Raphidocelis subcapitata]
MIGQLSRSTARRAVAPAGRGAARAQVPRRVVGVADGAKNGTTSSSSNGSHASACPTPAETARTIVDIVNEGALCSLCADGSPLGAPVAYALDSDGQPVISLASASPEAANLARDARASLLVQPTAFPARGVASVALQGTVAPHDLGEEGSGSGAVAYKLNVAQCVYYGGLDNSGAGVTVSGEDYRGAEPDTLRRFAGELIGVWNNDRAEDIYRIVAAHLGAALVDMAYAELLWLDRLGMYIRAEVAGGPPQVVRVPFYRPVLDERDARSVITMAAQIAWEAERSYVPPLPDAAAAAAAVNN